MNKKQLDDWLQRKKKKIKNKMNQLDKRQKWMCGILFAFCLYVMGFISQYFANQAYYNNYKTSGATMEFPSFHPVKCFVALFYIPYSFQALLLECAIVGVILLFMYIGNGKMDKDERGFSYSNNGTYGTSGFMTPKEMEQVLEISSSVEETKGTILGIWKQKVISVPLNSRMNKNIAVYGASGSMKSRAYVRNYIMQTVLREESLIITDPSGEMYEDTAVYLEEHGYVVKQFNLVFPTYSDSWNCLSEVDQNELMAQIFADVVIRNTSNGKTDHFWDNAEMNLLKALILYVENEMEKSKRNIGEVYNLITKVDEKTLEKIFAILSPSHPAKAPFNIYQRGEGAKPGIIMGLGTRLQVFQSQEIYNVTACNDIDLALPGQQKCAYFVITNEQDSTFDFLSSLFFSFLFIKLANFAKSCEGRKLLVPVNVLLDEFPNIGIIPDFNKKISTVRKYDINVSVIFQNLAQMKNRYPDDVWQEIIGNCDVQLFLGCTDELTAEFIAKRTGVATIQIQNIAKQYHTLRMSDYVPEYRNMESDNQRYVMNPDEILRMDLAEELIILRGQKVLKAHKMDYTRHPESEKLTYKKVSEHVPMWKLKEETQKEENKEALFNEEESDIYFVQDNNVSNMDTVACDLDDFFN